MAAVKAIPEGYHTVTPYIVVHNAGEAIDFYKNAFGAEEVFRMPGPNGEGVMHAELRIGDSVVMLCDEMPQSGRWKAPHSLKGTSVALHIYVEDVDKAFQKAIDAGASATMPVMDTFWGDRYGKLTDPFGHDWSIATHKKDLTPQEIMKGAEEYFQHIGTCSQ